MLQGIQIVLNRQVLDKSGNSVREGVTINQYPFPTK